MTVKSAYEQIMIIIFGNQTYNENQWLRKDISFKEISDEYTKNFFIEKAKNQRPIDSKTSQMLEALFKNALQNGYTSKQPDAMIRSLVEYLENVCHFDAHALLIMGENAEDELIRKETAFSLFKYVLTHLEGKTRDTTVFDEMFIRIMQECLNTFITRNTSPIKISEQYNHIHPVSGKFYCTRNYITEQIDALFEHNNIVFIVGVSGSGKSELCRHYGECKQKTKHFNNVIPLRLAEDGSGDINTLASQIMHSHSSAQLIGFNTFSLIEDNDLIILDNYNNPDNSVIHNLIDCIPDTKIIVTAQSYSMDTLSLGGVILLDEIETQHSLFSSNIFCTYGGIIYDHLQESEKKSIEHLMNLIGHHTMVAAMLGRQYSNLNQNLNIFLEKVSNSVKEAIGINYKVSLIKDDKKYVLTPHALVNHLFKNKILQNNFSEIERQVLGAIILCEGYSSNVGLICTLIGDSDVNNLYDARASLNELHTQGIIILENENVFIHPLIKALVSDPSIGTVKNESLAELSYDFHVHLTKNKLVEMYSISNPKSIANFSNHSQGFHTWVLDVIEHMILKRLKSEIEWLGAALEDNHYYVNCKSPSGSAIYLHWESGNELCILDASHQELAEYRYFNSKPGIHSDISFEYSILLKYVGNAAATYVLPDKVANASVTKISRSLFRGNRTIENITLPSSLSRIPDYAFCDCINLRSVIIPDSVKSIGTRSFYNCNQLESLELGKSLEYISIAAFAHCRSLKGELIFPNGLYDIHRLAFAYCSNITNVVLPNTLDDIGGYVFDSCTSLTEVKLSERLVKLPTGIFQNCHSLKKIHIPANIKTIDENVFYNCKSLTTVTMDEGVEKILRHAFYYCDKLEFVQFPSSLTFIDRVAVKDCPNAIIEIIPNSTAELYMKRYTTEMNSSYNYQYKN